jgi:TPR repeat protein
VMHQLGGCVFQDARQAQFYYRRACRLRTREGCDNNRRLRSR